MHFGGLFVEGDNFVDQIFNYGFPFYIIGILLEYKRGFQHINLFSR